MVITIPSMSYDGISSLPLVGLSTNVAINGAATSVNQGFISYQCGGLFGAYGVTASTYLGQQVGPVSTVFPPVRLVCKYTTADHKFSVIASYISYLHSPARVQPFSVGVAHGAPSNGAVNNGFRLEYTQVLP